MEADAQHQLTLMFSLSNSSNILFSERVILAEGKTENKLLPYLIEKISNRTLALNKCALVPQGGSGNTRKSMLVLNTMDLPCKAIADLDYTFKHAIEEGYLAVDDQDIDACKTEMANIAAANGINLENDWPTNQNSSMSASSAFALLAQNPNVIQNIQNLKAKMQEHNIWIWTKGTIENHLNLAGRTEQIWARFVNDVETNGLEATLPDDHLEIRDCINWLLQ